MVGKQQQKISLSRHNFLFNKKKVSESVELANMFNGYFVKVMRDLAE